MKHSIAGEKIAHLLSKIRCKYEIIWRIISEYWFDSTSIWRYCIIHLEQNRVLFVVIRRSSTVYFESLNTHTNRQIVTACDKFCFNHCLNHFYGHSFDVNLLNRWVWQSSTIKSEKINIHWNCWAVSGFLFVNV